MRLARVRTWVIAAFAGLGLTLAIGGRGPALPNPTDAWPNLPAGYSAMAEQSFNRPLARPWSLIWNQLGLGGIAADAKAPLSPPGVMQFRYAQGFSAGESPGTVVVGLNRSRRAFIGLWWKANAEWEGHESNVNKIQFVFPSEPSGDIYMAAYGPPGGPYELRCALQFVDADKRGWLRPNAGGGRVIMGGWHRIEWLLEYSTPGAHNGVVRWWLDGRLVGDYRDVLFPREPFSEFKLSPTWGGMGGAKSHTDYFWYDHIFIASR